MKRKVLGHVTVDSGQLMICDPCYPKGWDCEFDPVVVRDADTSSWNYSAACKMSLSEAGAGIIGDGRGAVSRTSSGDGRYKVTLVTDDAGNPVRLEVEL